jgi:type II secretory ATPase GspE/PulE/Tfp pilus assembly ATPase PilB-like protein
MAEVPTTLNLPQCLIDAATTAAHRQGMTFEAMVSLVMYEYAEKHTPVTLSVTQEHIPFVVRLANSMMVSAVQKGASEIRLIPQISELIVVVQVDGNSEELTRYPSHIAPQLYDRLITMASHGIGIRQPMVGAGTPGLIPVTTQGHNYDVLLDWSGSYQRDIVLQITKVTQ